MSNVKKVDFELIYNELIEKKEHSFEDSILVSYLINTKKKHLNFFSYQIKKEKEKENKDDKLINEAEQKKSDIENLIKNLESRKILLDIKSLSEVINTLILKNPNNFNNYDYGLIDALIEHNFNLRMVLRKRTKKVFFRKNDNTPIYSFKNIPYKKDFKNLYNFIKYQGEILFRLSEYKIWTAENQSINGLTIHKDRKRYKSINDKAIKIQTEMTKEKFNIFFCRK